MQLKISVIIPVFNAEKYIVKAVESALQFTEVEEILLVEDCSSDDSLKICLELEALHQRVKILQHSDKKNHGAGASRNKGIKNAKCSYIAFLDADDYYLSNRFDTDKKIFSETPNVDGVYNALGVHYYSNNAKEVFLGCNFKELTTVNKEVSSKDLFESLIGIKPNIGYFHLDCLTLKKDSLKKMDSLFNPSLVVHQDTDFIIRITYYLKLLPGEINKPTAIRGVHDDNRITKVAANKEDLAKNRIKLYSSLLIWACKNNLPDNNLEQICKIKNNWIKKSFKARGEINQSLSKENQNLKRKLDDIYKSKAWRLIQILRKIKKPFSKLIKRDKKINYSIR